MLRDAPWYPMMLRVHAFSTSWRGTWGPRGLYGNSLSCTMCSSAVPNSAAASGKCQKIGKLNFPQFLAGEPVNSQQSRTFEGNPWTYSVSRHVCPSDFFLLGDVASSCCIVSWRRRPTTQQKNAAKVRAILCRIIHINKTLSWVRATGARVLWPLPHWPLTWNILEHRKSVLNVQKKASHGTSSMSQLPKTSSGSVSIATTLGAGGAPVLRRVSLGENLV